jgi:hypothetical protein
MGKKRPKKEMLASDMMKLRSWRGIRISVVPDDRSPEEIQATRRAIWRNDRIWERPEGFSLVSKGRAGSIYFRRGNKIIDVEAELAGNPALDIVVSEGGLARWIDVYTLECEPVSREEQVGIRTALIDWLTRRGTKFSLGGVIITQR